jgi:hypothetical protein
VAVLRRPQEDGPFEIEQPPGDFVGATSAELYTKLFKIEERDEVYLEAATSRARGHDAPLKRTINALREKQQRRGLSAEEEQRLTEAALQLGRIARVEELEEREHDKDDRIADLEAEVARLRDLLEAAKGPTR